eukprot:4631272-Prymnesium_polylepis.1
MLSNRLRRTLQTHCTTRVLCPLHTSHTSTTREKTTHSQRASREYEVAPLPRAPSLARSNASRMVTNPVTALKAYFGRLTAAFGWRYVAAVMMVYGGNQGMGEAFVGISVNSGARGYFLQDVMGLSSARRGQLEGFAHIPWQLKSLFGLLSDTLPINGLHRSPYMILAGVLGVGAMAFVTLFDGTVASNYPLACAVFLCSNLNFAMPDVMIDATVATRGRERPELMASLQALCWASLG